jgi:prefoldin alpha subunit
MSQSPSSNAGNAVDITTLPVPQLSSLQQRLSSELEHLSTSYQRLRAAQTRFKDCIRSIQSGVQSKSASTPLLIPLTTSLYVPGTLASNTTVLVDVGTGFFVEKSTDDAVKFYEGKVEELGKNLSDIEGVVGGKSQTLKGVEDVLRQKVLAQQGQGQGVGGGGGGEGGKG